MKRGHIARALICARLSPFCYSPAPSDPKSSSSTSTRPGTRSPTRCPSWPRPATRALWLPPPTKGSGGLSVGYDLWDPFDLGGQDQRGTVRTRYGTEAELLRLIETAHRFGIRVYFDNIMNHRAFDVPGYNEYTPIDIYPGHAAGGFPPARHRGRLLPQVGQRRELGRHLAGAEPELLRPDRHRAGDARTATSAPRRAAHIPKIRFVRHPNNPEYYDYAPDARPASGFGSTNITTDADRAANAGLLQGGRRRLPDARASAG